MECIGRQKLHKAVCSQTLLHHVISPENQSIPNKQFYFCASIDCEIVYFSECGDRFNQDQVRDSVGQKQTSTDQTICYCFDITEQDSLDDLSDTGESAIKTFVIEQTKEKSCACEIRNPLGQYCLADFNATIKTARKNGVKVAS